MNEYGGQMQTLLDMLADPDRIDWPTVMARWQSRDMAPLAAGAELYRMLAERLLEVDESLMAYDVVVEGLNHSPGDMELRRLEGLALARSGATEKANRILEDLVDANRSDPQSLSQLASSYKSLWRETRDPARKQALLRKAFETYMEAYRAAGDYHPGVNAAALAMIGGQWAVAEDLARRVQASCIAKLETLRANDEDDYWCLATLGETALIQDDLTAAEKWYAEAVAAAGQRYGNINASRRQAKLLAESQGDDVEKIASWFPAPTVIVFTGHMIDAPNRPAPRFPQELQDDVRSEISAYVNEQKNQVIGFSSAACGADIMFLEEVLSRDGDIHIVLPFGVEEFAAESVDVVPGWRKRYMQVLRRAKRVLTISPQKLGDGSVSHDYNSRVLGGLALLQADQLEAATFGLAAWNGKPGDSIGGTATIVDHWKDAGISVKIVDLDALLRKHRTDLPTLDETTAKVAQHGASPQPAEDGTRIMAMLFCDVKGFSKLSEQQYPLFVEHFLGRAAELIAESRNPPCTKNTWGDAIRLDFESVEHAGIFALDLADRVTNTTWDKYGLPRELGLRIGLHAGPVYASFDPIRGQQEYIGAHVSQTARIEPITPPGQVYASQNFAALARFENVTDFECEYVGQVPLPKGFGTFPTYHVRRPKH